MGETTAAGDAADVRLKRIAFRAWHRGIRETDLIFGRFADARLATLSEVELDAFERLLDVPDRDILDWVTGMEPVPDDPNRHLLDRIIAFHRS